MSTDFSKNVVEREATLLVEFVNTLDIEEAVDKVATPASLAQWAEGRPELPPPGRLSAAEHRQLIGLRESLRAVMATNNGGEAGGDELGPLRAAAESTRLRTQLSDDARVNVEPAGRGAEALQARLLLAAERLQLLGAWERLKACPAEDCRWAFFDTSRNRSRTWCSMDVCGNRQKTRRYRQSRKP